LDEGSHEFSAVAKIEESAVASINKNSTSLNASLVTSSPRLVLSPNGILIAGGY
jgi:hypothetical protein